MTGKSEKILCALLFLVSSSATLWPQESPPSPPTSRQEPSPTTDPKEIVRRALTVDQTAFQLSRNYTFERRVELKILNKRGNVKKHEINTYDVTNLYDEPYSRRIRKDHKALSDADEKREVEKEDQFIAERKNESEEEHEIRLAREEKERQQERAFVRDIINAYDFRIVGDDQVDGHDTYVVEAFPRKVFHPTQPHADILPKLHGKLWISKRDYGCAKVEAETTDTISWGLFLLRIHQGTTFRLEQTYVNDEIWLPRHMSLDASARVALFENGAVDWESSFANYKKFTTGVRILPGAAQIQPPPNASPQQESGYSRQDKQKTAPR